MRSIGLRWRIVKLYDESNLATRYNIVLNLILQLEVHRINTRLKVHRIRA